MLEEDSRSHTDPLRETLGAQIITEEPTDEADAIAEGDLVQEEGSRSHTDLLRETLGAQIITEEPN
ncbi:hypothetical protein [Kribbella swartbergensis]